MRCKYHSLATVNPAWQTVVPLLTSLHEMSLLGKPRNLARLFFAIKARVNLPRGKHEAEIFNG